MKADGNLMRITRIERGHSLSGLGRKLGIDKAQLSRVERGIEGLSPGKMRKLATELDLPMDRLAPDLAQMKADAA